MFGHRPDGRRVKSADPYLAITPFIMKTRNDALNLFEETVPCDSIDAYIKKRRADGRELSYLHVFVATAVRLYATHPRLNRYICNKRIYARDKIRIGFDVHKTLRTDDAGTNIKLEFEGTETMDEICDKIDAAIRSETIDKTEGNATDNIAAKVMGLPSFLISGAVNMLMWMDKHGMLGKWFVDLSPFHASMYITYLKSLGISSVFHHIYNFGSVGMFLCIGKEKYEVLTDRDHQPVVKKALNLKITVDERYCDGLYFARVMKDLKKILRNLESLETPLEARMQDDP